MILDRKPATENAALWGSWWLRTPELPSEYLFTFVRVRLEEDHMEPILLSLDKVLQLYGYIPKMSYDAFGMFWWRLHGWLLDGKYSGSQNCWLTECLKQQCFKNQTGHFNWLNHQQAINPVWINLGTALNSELACIMKTILERRLNRLTVQTGDGSVEPVTNFQLRNYLILPSI